MNEIARIYYFQRMKTGLFLNCREEGTRREHEKAGGEKWTSI